MRSSNKVFDSLLVMQCQSGNKKAITLLVKRWHAKLCKQAYWYTKNIEVSKDIAQDSWGVIFLKINKLRDPDGFGSWALTIVSRKAIDWQRKHTKEREYQNSYRKDQSMDEENVQDDKKSLTVLKQAIRELPHNQQMVLNLFYLEEYSIKQISEIINISTGTVKSRLFTAREKLKLILKNKNYEE